MQITLNDPFLGERTIPNTNIDLIRDQLRLLRAMRDKGRPTLHLLRDIKVYEYIVHGADPEALASAYLDKAEEMRRETGSILVSKSDIAKALGWQV